VRGLDEFRPILSEPLPELDTQILEGLCAQWEVTLPRDFLEFLSTYGDSEISGFLRVSGPRTLGFVGEFFGPGLPDWDVMYDTQGILILPTERGMLLWGSTLEGDMLCL
jgi:hypothetical protein